MRKATRITVLALAALVALTACAQADHLIGSPDMAPSRVDAGGVVHEDWGTASLVLEEPAGIRVTGQIYEAAPVPTVVTTKAAGTIVLTETVYRAPLWPSAADVLTARIENTGSEAQSVRLRLALPETVSTGEHLGVLGGRPVVGLLAKMGPRVRTRAWGCSGGVSPLPGWAKPNAACDPAFRNISAGMGGVPIEYAFAVPDGQKRTVVLGFCESHWSVSGHRPLKVSVEGTPETEVDPIARWGQHGPGCLEFDAFDHNGDGYLDVVISPHPNATDKNTILNVIWVFEPGVSVDPAQVLRGELTDRAAYYVDVGGQKDQPLYEGGPVAYDLDVAAGEATTLAFLLAGPGAQVPNPQNMAWTLEAMRKAADDVWRDWLGQAAKADLLDPAAEERRQDLARIAMSRFQANGYFAALPEPGRLDSFTHAHAARCVALLDEAGIHDEAERLLRVYWDAPVPEPLAALTQAEDGRWRDPVDDPCAQGLALDALAGHALATGDLEWASWVWPKLKAGTQWLANPEAQAGLTPEARKAAARGLQSCAQVAKMLDQPEAESLDALAKQLLEGG